LDYNGRPIANGVFSYKRDAAKRTGALANWTPRKVYSRDQEARERSDIIARSINLINDDPHAAGVVDAFATTIIGAGLKPIPSLNSDALGLTKDEVKNIETQQKQIYKEYSLRPDASMKMTDGEIQFLKCRCLFGFGESLEILSYRETPYRRFGTQSQVINPERLKTPADKINDGNIRDGIEVDKWGVPVYYWIKKASKTGQFLSDSSDNFVRVPARKGHRIVVLHDYITKDPEQMRGYPILAPAMRTFREFGDLIGAELTSNVVTSALSLFVESENPGTVANAFMNTDDYDEDDRMQEMTPGQVWYGSPGEKPHLLGANRPGNTFEPFTRLLKKAFSSATGIPLPVLFKDIDGISFAGFRAAMLEAWRVYTYHRTRIGSKDCQTKYNMVMEEAYLKDFLNLPKDDFYENMAAYTNADWYGAPKGDIEPYKAIQADIMKFKAGVKPLERIILEDGGPGVLEVATQIEDELRIYKEKNIPILGEEKKEVEEVQPERGQDE